MSAFLVDNYKNLSPDPGDVAIALLTQISLQLASNGSYAQSISPTKPFHPSRSAILVNALWFTSLILGLLCALGAILIQQWTRAYQQAIDHRPAPLKKGESADLSITFASTLSYYTAFSIDSLLPLRRNGSF